MSVAGADRQHGSGRASIRTRLLRRWPWSGRAAAPFGPAADERSSLLAALQAEFSREARARTGFYLVPLGLLIGSAAFYGANWRLSPSVVALGLLAVATLGTILRPERVGSALLTIAAFVLIGQGLSLLELARTDTTIFSGEATVRIDGRVLWRDEDERGRFRYLLDVEATQRPVLSRPPERVRILVSSRHEPIPIGGRYEGLVRLTPPSGPAMPGAYDFAYAPFFAGLGAYGYSLGAPAAAARVEAIDLSLSERIAARRVAMAERIRAVVPGAEGAVASALITGERAGIPDEVEDWLRVTGLAHVLSISGFHMALVAGFTMLVVRAGAAATPGLALLFSTKKIAAIAALLVATAYFLLAGDNVATQRSWIMLAIMLGAVLLDRPALTLRNVALAAIVVLALNPHAVTTASFQMSFAATAALVGAYGGLMRWWAARAEQEERSRRGMVAAAAAAVLAIALSSLIAGAATAPFGAYHFQRATSLGGVVANVAAMPLFTFWIMPAALVAVLLMPLGLDGPVLRIVGEGLSVVFRMAETLARWFPDHATGLMGTTALLLLTGAILALSFLAGRLRFLALPLAVGGCVALLPVAPSPELIVFEDGREVALVDAEGRLRFLQERPSDFIADQWRRAYPGPTGDEAVVGPAFDCRDDVCRALSRSGLQIAWTENYERTGELCDTADIAIVARAIRLPACRSGAYLVTLRTLRRTGSLAVDGKGTEGRLLIRTAVSAQPEEWNRHRLAAWPEYWSPEEEVATGGAIELPTSPHFPSAIPEAESAQAAASPQ